MSAHSLEPSAKSKTEADLRLLAGRARLVALLAMAVIFAALLQTLNVLPLVDPLVRAVTTADGGLFWTTVLTGLNRTLPVIPFGFYLLAVLGALGILDHISEGEYFSARNIRALGDMGGSLLWGAIWAAFAIPSLSDWTNHIGGYRVDFRPETLVIATIGLCLLVIGRLFLRAQNLETAMEEIV